MKCFFTHCQNKAELVPILVFPVYKNGGIVRDSPPNRAKIQQPMCERCTKLLHISNFMTPSAIGYYKANYSQRGIEFPPISAITLDFIPYEPPKPHEC